jgi:hypothetical protein
LHYSQAGQFVYDFGKISHVIYSLLLVGLKQQLKR